MTTYLLMNIVTELCYTLPHTCIFEYISSFHLLCIVVGLLQTVLSAAIYGCQVSCVSI